MIMKKLDPMDRSAPTLTPRAIHMYFTATMLFLRCSLTPLGQSMPNFTGSGNQCVHKQFRSHDQMAAMPIYVENPSKSVSLELLSAEHIATKFYV